MGIKPHHQHDCERCQFLGTNDTSVVDFYFCPGEGSLIYRMSDELGDYASFKVETARLVATSGSLWAEAVYLYDHRNDVVDEDEAPEHPDDVEWDNRFEDAQDEDSYEDRRVDLHEMRRREY